MIRLREEIRRHLPRGGEVRRLFHGRGRCLAGYEDLVIDAYGSVILVMLYQEREESWLESLTELLRELVPETRAVLLQQRFLSGAPSRLLWGELPDQLLALEDGLKYSLRLGQAQNPGFFPDMAHGRRLVRQIARGKRVLNLFAYTCGFSVAALAGGARAVVNLDMNRGALEVGRRNHELNGLDVRQASFLAMELFRSAGKLRKLGPFDLVICDPPATQGQSFTAERHWPKLIRLLPGWLAPSAQVLACLNGPYLPPGYLEEAFSELLPQAMLVETRWPGEDFPEAQAHRGSCLYRYQMP